MRLLVKPPECAVGTRETYVPPLGLWSMRGCASDVMVYDAHLHGMEMLGEVMKLASVVGVSHQFQTQDSVVKEIAPCHCPVHFGGQAAIGGWRGAGEAWIDPRFAHFAAIPLPRFELDELEPYWKRDAPFDKSKTKRWMTVETSRGCGMACGFCGMTCFWGGWQGRNIGQLSDYFCWLKEIGVEELFIVDDNVSLDRERFISIVELLADLGLQWSCPNGIYARSLLDRKVLTALSYSTCWRLSLPFETGSETSARLMHLGRKWLSPAEAKRLTAELAICGIECVGFFVIGYPGETVDDVQRTLDYANALPLTGRYIYFATPYRGTPLEKLCRENGWIVGDVTGYRLPSIETPWLKRSDLELAWRKDRESHVV